MPLTTSERKRLVMELDHIRKEIPEVTVRIDAAAEVLAANQSRVDEIERALAADAVTRTPAADLEGP